MITSWRKYFGVAGAFFGIVILEPWVGGPSPGFRAVQMQSVAALAGVGYAAGMDIGDPTGPFGSVHPRNKRLIGRRLANAALTLQYGAPATYLAPSPASSTAAAAGTAVTVTVAFDNVPTTLVAADDHCQTELGVPAAQCFWFSILTSDGKVHNATAAVGADGKSVVLSATVDAAGTTAVATTFGNGQVSGLPRRLHACVASMYSALRLFIHPRPSQFFSAPFRSPLFSGPSTPSSRPRGCRCSPGRSPT